MDIDIESVDFSKSPLNYDMYDKTVMQRVSDMRRHTRERDLKSRKDSKTDK